MNVHCGLAEESLNQSWRSADGTVCGRVEIENALFTCRPMTVVPLSQTTAAPSLRCPRSPHPRRSLHAQRDETATLLPGDARAMLVLR